MGKFTVYEDPTVDEQLQCQLDTIVEVIIKHIRDVKSIVLTGGFGRGEGSVRIINDKVLPLKDYDIRVYVKKKPKNEIALEINSEIYKKLKMTDPLENDFCFSHFVVDIVYAKKDNIGSFPDISTYELKVASTILYGEDLREKIPWEIDDIPLSSGLRFLFEKMSGMIGHFSQEYLLDFQIDEKKRKLIIYECYKTYVEIATCLCLLMDCYEPSFKKRMELFEKYFKDKLPDLYKEIPDLSEWVRKTTKFKLKPKFEEVDEDIIDLWFHTRDILCKVIRYYLETFLDTKITHWTDSYEELCDLMKIKYYQPRIGSFLEKKIKKISLNNKYFVNLLNFFIHLYLINGYTYKLLVESKIVNTNPFKHLQAPIIRMYLISPIILSSINRDGSIEKKNFNEAKKRLIYLRPLEKFDDKIPWDALRKTHLKIYYDCGRFR